MGLTPHGAIGKRPELVIAFLNLGGDRYISPHEVPLGHGCDCDVV